MKRRQLLQMTVVGTVGLTLPGFSWLAAQPARWQTFAHPALLTLLGDHGRVREIGSAFRRAFPEQSAPQALVAAIMSDSGFSGRVAAPDRPGRLDQQIRSEFAQGRTVQLNGWILSVTEARQCALYSILTS
jgi:hypothetical protein